MTKPGKMAKDGHQIDDVRQLLKPAFFMLCEGQGCAHEDVYFGDLPRLAAVEFHKRGWRQGHDKEALCRKCAEKVFGSSGSSL